VGINVETGPSVGLALSSCVEGAEGAGEGAADGLLVGTSINRVGYAVGRYRLPMFVPSYVG
jgi:hypothetical protein